MRKIPAWTLLLAIAVCFGKPVLGHDDHSSSPPAAITAEYQLGSYGDQLGTVDFQVSCSDTASRYLEEGLALLHHMTYEGAERAFAAATAADPDCAMGYWGQAMSYIHPLWADPPSEAKFQRGQALLKEARTRGQKTERESAYIAAVEAYYAEGWDLAETANLAAFEQGWEKVHRQFPEDPEAASFYALAHMAKADPGDKTYARQRRAAAIAEQVLARIPDHPGAHHYIIHAYDYPPLAEQALEVALRYGKIAPEVPHALHMPTHIFTRLGRWQESIEMNNRSAAAALKQPVDGAISLHYLHALDYVVYAHLQQAQNRQAKEVLNTIEALEGPVQPHIASAYTLAAAPARLALERQHWTDAVQLEPRTPGDYPWDGFPAMEAITHFARALGAARSGDDEVARQALDRLAVLRDYAAETSAYWAKQVEIQRRSALAWLDYQQGRQDEGLEMMRQAAELEATTEKHPVTPGEILPARELLADMLLEMERYEEAQAEYETALARSPNRFNSLYGVGRAAELKGDRRQAAEYYQRLIEVAENADAERERLQHARAFLAANQGS